MYCFAGRAPLMLSLLQLYYAIYLRVVAPSGRRYRALNRAAKAAACFPSVLRYAAIIDYVDAAFLSLLRS